MADIFESSETYKAYLVKQSLLDLQGIARRLDGATYPDRAQLVAEEIAQKILLEQEKKQNPPDSFFFRIKRRVFG